MINKPVTMEMLIAQADVPTPAGLVYSRDALQHVVDKVHNSGRPLCGELVTSYAGMSVRRLGMIDEASVSHQVHDMKIDEQGRVTARFTPRDTPKGRLLQEMLSGEKPLVYFGIRGYCETVKKGETNVVTNLALITVDAISNKP